MTADRREFCTITLMSCCGMSMCFAPGSVPAEQVAEQPRSTAETPADKKVEFTKGWVQRFMQVLDSTLDEETRHTIMQANGRACYAQHAPPPREEHLEPAVFVGEMAQYVGEESCYLEDGKIYFNYSQNPNGLKIADGFCLCPMVEDGPERLSATYCQCSVGYVSAMMSHYLGPITGVELLESLRTGGKSCRFLVHL